MTRIIRFVNRDVSKDTPFLTFPELILRSLVRHLISHGPTEFNSPTKETHHFKGVLLDRLLE